MGLRAALGEDRPLRRQADPRQRRPRAEPPVSQPEGRDDLPALRPAAVRDSGRAESSTKREMLPGRARPHHAEDHSPHDGDRRQRHLRGLDARAARRRAARGPLRETEARGTDREVQSEARLTIPPDLQSRSGRQNGMSSSVSGSGCVRARAGHPHAVAAAFDRRRRGRRRRRRAARCGRTRIFGACSACCRPCRPTRRSAGGLRRRSACPSVRYSLSDSA